jgi:hypothetical protein
LALATAAGGFAKARTQATPYAFADFAGSGIIGNFIELHCRIP